MVAASVVSNLSRISDELRRDQGHVQSALDRVKALGFNSAAGVEAFYAMKNDLLSYMAKGDERLYRPLRDASAQDSNLNFLLTLYATGWDMAIPSVQQFFNRYPSAGSDMEFFVELGKIMAVISMRVGNESGLLNECSRLKS